ncbi:RimJ/RimL family protein N-acetyltransferase [Haloferula luteola]|uniref:RimJ/RimL family protein N-acetyltransferase n=1 Tax=Haloferula luteola TaxID=595692 RepID=A0A840UXP5_9BACT|nr:GNAT family protein [Haloferula luteola]MBB5350927.1 RimJ/RimL family protein N-acetyltransferase [Haloferula luteola]
MKTQTNKFGQPIGDPLLNWASPMFPQNTSFEGRTCWLEPLDPDAHAEGLYAACSKDQRGSNWTYLPYGPFDSFEDYRAWLTSMSSLDDPQFYAIRSRSTGNPVGLASYLSIDPDNGSIEVGHIHFSESLKQSIAATEAMYLMMKSAFSLGYRRYQWRCDALNAPSRSAAQRLGLSFEGIFRNATVYKGRNRDTAWFAAIDSEWPSLDAAFSRWLHPDNFDREGRQVLSLRELTRPILKNAIEA